MPAIKALFNRFLRAFGSVALGLFLISSAAAQFPTLTDENKRWLGQQIFANECNSDFKCLTSWNEGEDFPSLGIGHFIWFQANQQGNFTETFPQLVRYLETQGAVLPLWLQELPDLDSPWTSRGEFLNAVDSPRMISLREMLANTIDLQVDFIVQRAYDALPSLLEATDSARRERVRDNFYQVAEAEPPHGVYAIIDYTHFKGEGTATTERYHGQGWGLLQVLENMRPDPRGPLQSFVTAAGLVLEIRVVNAPPARWERRWLEGWQNRLQTYLP